MNHFEIDIPTGEPKDIAINILIEFIKAEGFNIIEFDKERPWGAFAKIDDNDIHEFIGRYFDNDPILIKAASEGKMSPKFLLVAPDGELSWQYHFRRAEEWTVLHGPVGVFVSDTDVQPDESAVLTTGEKISLATSVRHRLVGCGQWGVVAEIWRHTDAANLSDEDDIVRLTDTYGRSTPQS